MTASAAIRRRPGRDYPPLLIAATVLLGILAVLPSALNLPQTNPSQTLEYAPVPPEDEETSPPPSGNLGSLSLAGSQGLGQSEGSGVGAGGAGGPLAAGAGKNPSTKRCVGNPPRQTEDPLSPPCVAHFAGDNGGSTYQGVSGDEVRVLIIVDGFVSEGNYKGAGERWPYGQNYDLAKPMKDEDHSVTRYLRAWQRYFNDRYQAYGRNVHFFAYYAKSAGNPETRRAEAVENFEKVKPFATVWPVPTENVLAYNEVMARRGVVTFSGQYGLKADIFRRFPKLAWGLYPSLEEHAKSFGAFLCEAVSRHPVGFSGNPGENGKPRRYGLIYSGETGATNSASTAPLATDFVALVRPQIARCGIEFAAERTHPYHGVMVDSRTSGDYAAEAMATFQQEGVTTIIWMLGYETNFSKSAAAINYRPEWILAGDGFQEGSWSAQSQEQSVWDHAISYTFGARTAWGGVSEVCKQAYLEVDPEIPRGTLDLAMACFFYGQLGQFFTGVQVAGPRLNPATMDRGFHAIPAVRSTNPAVPACFYGPGDYTCIKDGTVVWFDAEYQDENSSNTKGCWRLTDGGSRYLPGGWPEGNVNSRQRPTDPCNGYLGTLLTIS